MACLAVCDAFICLFVIFPLSILHWRGTWGLQELYITPLDQKRSALISFVIGCSGGLVLPLLKLLICRCVTPGSRVEAWVWRLYMYISGWFVMAFWRGTWDTADNLLGTGWVDAVLLYVTCQTISVLTLTVRNNVGTPFSIALDGGADLKQEQDLVLSYQNPFVKPFRYLGNILYTQFVIVLSNVLVWRCIWNIYDLYLFPGNHLLSDLVSLCLGYAVCLQLFMLQVPAGIVSERLEKISWRYKVAFEDLIMIATTWANLLLWRGAWDLTVAYFIPDPLVGDWVSHWLGTVGLIALQTFNVVALNAVELDGSFPGGEGIFPTNFLRALLPDSKKKTLHPASSTEALLEAVGESESDQDNNPRLELLDGRESNSGLEQDSPL